MEDNYEYIQLTESPIVINTIDTGNDSSLKVDYIVRFYENKKDYYEITAADYYYEAYQLLLIYQFSNEQLDAERFYVAQDFLSWFRYLIYKTACLFKKENIIRLDDIKRGELLSNIWSLSRYLVSQLKVDNLFEFTYGYRFYRSISSIYNILRQIYGTTDFWKEIDVRFNKTKCVAIAYKNRLPKKTLYLSLSGSSCDYEGKNREKISGWEVNPKIQEAYEAVSAVYKTYWNCPIVQCHLSGKVRRYVQLNKKNGIILTKSKSLKNDLLNYKDPASIVQLRIHYSCCERKILSKIINNGLENKEYLKLKNNKTLSSNNPLRDWTFIVRRPPCEKCKPALVGCDKIIYDETNKRYHVEWNGKEFVLKANR